MAEFNSNSFLIELDSFGRPPPPQNIYGKSQTKEIATKLDAINMEKQRVGTGRPNMVKCTCQVSPGWPPLPSCPFSCPPLCFGTLNLFLLTRVDRELSSKLAVIFLAKLSKFQKMKGDLLTPSENGMVKLGNGAMPKKQQIKVEDAQKWRNDVLAMSRPKATGGFGTETPEMAREYVRQIRNSTVMNHSDSEDDRGTRSSMDSTSLPSPPGELSSPYLKIRTDHHHERKSSDYSSSSSHKSPSPPSQSSYSDYASLYKSQTNTPSPRGLDSPTKHQSFNSAFRSSVPVVTVPNGPRFSPVGHKSELPLPKTAPKTPAAPNFGYGPSLTQQIRVNSKPPSGRAPGFGSVTNLDHRRAETWRRIEAESNAQDRKFEELTRKLHENLVMDKRTEVGSCAHCQRPMYDTEDRYTVQENTYHSKCFVCEVCGKELKDQQFYLSGGRFFCKQDYFTEQMVQQRETLCAACKLPIQETVLSTLNRHFHPRCFRCTDCYSELDGVPFSADKENQAFCLPCFHNRYAPRCATCKRPITPDPETGESTRIVTSNKSYHVECYVCEGCNLVFDEEEKCYPREGHLLCRTCHLHWAKTRQAPITDL